MEELHLKKELDEKLQSEFPWLKQPELHREKPYEWVDGYNNYENYGFSEVGNGWYQLIYELCAEIEKIYKEAGQPVTMKLVQVKSKFARLRWYYDLPGKEQAIHAFDFIGNASLRLYPEGEVDSLESKLAECVRRYEAKSITICETCGANNAEICNEPPVFRWVSALCPKCKEDRIALYNSKMEERAQIKKKMLESKKKEE